MINFETVISAPNTFEGTWDRLYREHIENILPSAELVSRFHGWMEQYGSDPDAVFPVRQVKSAERRLIYSTADGTRIAPGDNSPATVIHALLLAGRLASYEEFRHHVLRVPTHVFDMRRTVKETANDRGWYVAHIFPAKNRDTGFLLWDRREVIRRFYLTLHPCNIFFVPSPRNRLHGEDMDVIRFIANQYAKRYASVWQDFLNRIHGNHEPGDTAFGSTPVIFPKIRPVAPPARPGGIAAPANAEGVAVFYRAARLTFKRDQIEPLGPNDVFEVAIPEGTYRFTKSEFYTHFPNIPITASYREIGRYHGKNLHLRAQRFRVL